MKKKSYFIKKKLKSVISVLTAISVFGVANYSPQNEKFSIKNLISVSASSSYGVFNYEVVGDEVVIVGLNDRNATEIEIPSDIKVLLEKREEARKSGDYENADKIRSEIEGKGFVIEDSKGRIRIRKA